MLVHTREPPADDGRARPAWEPRWVVWRWAVIAVVVGYAALNADGAIGALLILGSFYAGCRSLAEALPYTGGLTEWRQ